MTRFIVIRHGETHWNLAARVQGHLDSELTPAGIEQADAIARRLAREPFDLLVSSDLGRAHETARRIAKASGHAIRLDPRFRERHFGAGAGLTYAEIDRLYPDAFTRSREIDPDYAIPGGESRRAFQERVALAFAALAAEEPGKRITVVTHGGVLGALYRHIHGIAVATPHRIAITNASYNAITLDAGRWSVDAWADTAHLPGAAAFEET
jgi:2,3-bisphosphoglycerate-dependent phosphoglycerate mutase